MKMKKLLKLLKRKTVYFELSYKPFAERICNELYYSGGGDLIVKFEMPDKNYSFDCEKKLLFNDKYKIVKNSNYYELIDLLDKQADIETVSF